MKKVSIVLLVVIIAAAGYGVYAYTNKQWPFAMNSATTTAPQPIEISKTSVEKDSISIVLKKNLKDDGYCVLELRSTRAALTIDDSKTNKDPKFVNCTGWTVGSRTLPKGTYVAKVTMHSGTRTYDTSKQIEL